MEADLPAIPPDGPDGRPLNKKERVLEVLGDATARHILRVLDTTPHSVQDLLEANHIPQSTLYRKLHELRELGLVGIQTSLRTPDARRIDMFRSLVEEVQITVKGGVFDLRIRYRDLSVERLQHLWGSLREEARQ